MNALSPALDSMPTATLAFIAFIALCTVVLNIRFTRRKADLGPTLLTMLGIFGCFLGIATGLLHFNSADIQTGVPALINGIKTSFWVSVAGIAGALIIKIRVLTIGIPRPPATGVVEEATAADIANLLRQMNQSIAGNDDQTLLGQLKLLREDQREGDANLKQSFEHFADRVADVGSRALVKALDDVIKDFNAKLTVQFGDNFKQLNEALAQVVIWQQQYRAQMAVLIEQETMTRKSMTEAAARFGDMVSRSRVFIEATDGMAVVLEKIAAQRDQLDASLNQLNAAVARSSDGRARP